MGKDLLAHFAFDFGSARACDIEREKTHVFTPPISTHIFK